ncbi:MAG TPA: CheR family methyltransferase, partial [Lacipirellulaceae bacterium]|nr:CheR family methyltransferase [Lacipirellulaceae bacterium]
DLTRYLDLLRKQPNEVKTLADDLLVTVTSFFRDPAVFQELEKVAFPQIFDTKKPGDSIRVWSVGCATGEEAYSLAMLLIEEVTRRDVAVNIQIFASDLHERSLAKAREGFYPGDIDADVSPERLKRFFVKEDSGYRIRKEIRELVVFAPHNIMADPPFSRIDLVSCRNLLIYLQRELQRDVIELFHYALNPEGFLVLGTSETLDTADLFRTEDKKHCIYQKRNVPAPEPRLPVFPLSRGSVPPSAIDATDHQAEPIAYGKLHQRMIEGYAPPSLLVSPDDKVVHFSSHVGRYLVHPGGELTSSVVKLVRDELRVELRAVLHKSREQKTQLSSSPIMVKFNGELAPVVIHVRPAPEPHHEGYALIIFEEGQREEMKRRLAKKAGGAAVFKEQRETKLDELQTEIDFARQRTQAVIEEYETGQEELKSSNEELQSANEELRSTLEELETSKEELQSMNEELQTVNQENRHKVEELAQLSSDLQNLMAATDIATLYLDRDLRILRFTPKVSELFSVRLTDRGRPLSDLTHRLGYGDLQADAQQVLKNLVPVEREISDMTGRWYLTRLLPYRSAEDRIEGAVITFVEITDRKHTEQQLAEAKQYAETIIETLHEPLVVLNPDLTVKSCNRAFYEHFKVSAGATYGRKIYDLGNGQWNIPALRQLLEEVLPKNQSFTEYEVSHDFEDLGHRVMLLNGRRLDHMQLILLGIRDITDRKKGENELRESEQRLQKMVNVEGVGVLIFDKAGTLIEANEAFLNMTGYTRADVESHNLAWRTLTPPEYLEASERQMVRLKETGRIGPYEKEYIRKDGSRSWMAFAGASLGDDRIIEYCFDVTDRKRAEQALYQSETQFRTLVEQVQHYAIFMVDTEGCCKSWNEGVRRVLGFDEREFVGCDVTRLIFSPEDVAAGVPEAELKTAAETGTASNDRWMRRKGGERFYAMGITTALRDDKGQLIGFMKVMRDQTEQKQLEDELQHVAADLADINNRKDEFLATLAHELRNPLAPIRAGLELMSLAKDDPEILENTRLMMERQTKQLVNLVDDLLDVSRITRGKLSLRKFHVKLDDIIQIVIESSRPHIQAASHELIVNVPAEPIYLHADPNRLAQALSNLLNNAAKFTPDGGRIWLTAEQQNGEVCISVKDTGIGIPNDMLEQIFEMFTQIDRWQHKSDVGLGLGLTLVKSLIELHGGSINVTSEGAGRGSTFSVRLPVASKEALEKRDSPDDVPADKPASLRVLVVDDSKPAADTMSKVIALFGNDVRTAYDGKQALALTEEFQPQVILMDIGMPGMSGYEAAQRIRQQSNGNNILLIALTGWGQDSDRDRTKEAGFDHHIVKPADPSYLRHLLSEAKKRFAQQTGTEVPR